MKTMEATRASEFPTGPNWVYEPKWNGWRIRFDGHQMLTRSNMDVARSFDDLAPQLPAETILDGELIVLDGDHHYLHLVVERVHQRAKFLPARLVAFDILRHKGHDVRGLPWTARRQLLEGLPHIGFDVTSTSRDLADAHRWFHHPTGHDGVMAKRTDQPYGGRRWRKVKH